VLSSGDRRDDADLVAVLYGSILVLKEADVFVVEENVDEAADVSLFVTYAFSKAGIRFLQAGEDLGDCASFGGDYFFLSRQFAERRGDTNGCRHILLLGDG
jgi:hypothetical protein